MSTNSTSNDQADLASQVESVKSNVIGEKTVKMYLRGISRYLVWLYQNKRILLSDELLEVVGNNEEAYREHKEAGVGSLKKDAVLQSMRENTTVPHPVRPSRCGRFEKFLIVVNSPWEQDSLTIRFGHMKNDQDGTRSRDARHIYASPFLPEICPILSLAIYAAVFELGNSKLFPGGNQYDRFAKILRRLMEEPNMTNLLLTEGLKPSDIGTHSAHEGSATYVSSCSNSGPSAAAICIRAGWTLPGVQDTYIRYGAAGDRIVGSYVAGLPFEETGFEVLPPFFPDIDDSIHNAIHRCISNISSRLLRAGRFYLAR
ncbi:hypothetical protein GQ600_2454 [Phytophthora cactorum]|nr:hypothetical protein GQ600_2454 [Phytophthora cactorum]